MKNAPGRPRHVRGLARPSALAAALVAALASVSILPLSVRASDPLPAPVPDFQLRDENPASPRYHKTVSPRDYRLQISVIYFGAAG